MAGFLFPDCLFSQKFFILLLPSFGELAKWSPIGITLWECGGFENRFPVCTGTRVLRNITKWRVGRVVECGGLENRFPVCTGTRVRIPYSPPPPAIVKWSETTAGGLIFDMPFYTYILKSLSYSNYYYGHSELPDKRLLEHNAGKEKYTKGRRPWVMHYIEKFNTRSEAVKRERFFKSYDGYKYLKSENII